MNGQGLPNPTCDMLGPGCHLGDPHKLAHSATRQGPRNVEPMYRPAYPDGARVSSCRYAQFERVWLYKTLPGQRRQGGIVPAFFY